MEIINNFCEIKLCKNLDEIDQSFFNSKELEENEFEEKVKTEFLEKNDKQILDNFLSRILKEYPIYYPSIIILKINDDIKSTKSNIEINKNESLTEMFTKFNDKIFYSLRYNEVFKEIEELIEKELIDILVDSERIKNLANFITAEIYLRTKIPEEYIFTDDFIEISEKYSQIQKDKKSEKQKLIDLYFKNGEKNPLELLEKLRNL